MSTSSSPSSPAAALSAPSFKPGGRVSGQGNFRQAEIVALAAAYKTASTNAAIGTDQSASSFWNAVLKMKNTL